MCCPMLPPAKAWKHWHRPRTSIGCKPLQVDLPVLWAWPHTLGTTAYWYISTSKHHEFEPQQRNQQPNDRVEVLLPHIL